MTESSGSSRWWTVALGSPTMSANSVESTKGVRLRESSSCRSEIDMC